MLNILHQFYQFSDAETFSLALQILDRWKNIKIVLSGTVTTTGLKILYLN